MRRDLHHLNVFNSSKGISIRLLRNELNYYVLYDMNDDIVPAGKCFGPGIWLLVVNLDKAVRQRSRS